MEVKLDEIRSKLNHMESRITNNLKIQLQALVAEHIKVYIENALADCEKKFSDHLDESLNTSIQCVTDRLDSVIIHSKEMQSEIDEIKTSQAFINEEFEAHKNSLFELRSSTQILAMENQALQAKCNSLSEQLFQKNLEVENLDQYMRGDNLEFHCVPVQENENTDSIILHIGKLLGIDITLQDISVSHRLPGNSSGTPGIIARFTNRRIRSKFLELTWKHHIAEVARKLSRSVGILAKLRHTVPKSILGTLYFSLFYPHLQYGIVVWGCASKSALKRLIVHFHLHFRSRSSPRLDPKPALALRSPDSSRLPSRWEPNLYMSDFSAQNE